MMMLPFYFIFINLILVSLILMPKYLKFRNSDYEKNSGNSFLKTLFDRGRYGEFLTFSYLEGIDCYKMLLTNLYIPKNDGSTTEIDLLMLAPTGIYVFESKNYSGWIFGSEKSKNWTQTLQSKQKYKFFNPIWQNNSHITALKNFLEIYDSNLYKSYIVFSERCELKKIELDSKNIKVIKRNNLLETIKKDIEASGNLIYTNDLIEIYNRLKKHSNVDESIKKVHIENIKKHR